MTTSLDPQAHLEGHDLVTAPAAQGVARDEWLDLARNAYEGSSTYWEANFYTQWAHNIALFRSEHPQGSKYHGDAYKARSRLFRPKTRSAVRRNMAAGAVAFFATREVVSVEAENAGVESDRLAAAIRGELLNYRLRSPAHGIPWFVTALGALQDAEVTGAVCSYQDWLYEERDGRVVVDRPDVQLVPMENIRFDPAASWVDPINSSPYLIECMPMHVIEVEERMRSGEWQTLSRSNILSAKGDHDAVRSQRHGSDRQDPASDNVSAIPQDYEIVWVHRVFLERDGVDWVFYTLGSLHRLSEPVPRDEMYPHCKRFNGRPYVIGVTDIETHRPVPSGQVAISRDLQAEANDIVNQRRDNVRLALNKRYLVRRTSNADMRSLLRNVPGSVTVADSILEGDIRVLETPDVTSSAFREEQLNNVDFDDLWGSFGAASVQTNRSMNETVGGMQMLSQDANILTEFGLRVFSSTWVLPVLAQIDALEMEWESDEQVLAIAANRVRDFRALEQSEPGLRVSPDMLEGDVEVRVNVGFGSTDPSQRIQKLSLGAQTVAGMFPEEWARRGKIDDVADEIFGVLGYEDASRFLEREGDEDPRVQSLQQQVEQLTGALDSGRAEEEAKAQALERIEQFKAQAALELARLDGRMQLEVKQAEKSIRVPKLTPEDREYETAMKELEWLHESKLQAARLEQAERAEEAKRLAALQVQEREQFMGGYLQKKSHAHECEMQETGLRESRETGHQLDRERFDREVTSEDRDDQAAAAVLEARDLMASEAQRIDEQRELVKNLEQRVAALDQDNAQLRAEQTARLAEMEAEVEGIEKTTEKVLEENRILAVVEEEKNARKKDEKERQKDEKERQKRSNAIIKGLADGRKARDIAQDLDS